MGNIKVEKGKQRAGTLILVLFSALLLLQRLPAQWDACGLVGRWQGSGCVRSFRSGGMLLFMPDGETIVRERRGGRILIEPRSFRWPAERVTLDHPDRVQNTAVSVDGQFLATCAGSNGQIWLWALPTQTVIYRRPALYRSCLGKTLKFSPDNQLLAVGDTNSMELWRTADRRIIPIQGERALAFAPEGERVATVTAATTVAIWQLDPLERLADLAADPEGRTIVDLAFSPDGRLLAANTSDGKVYVWESDQQELILLLEQEATSRSNLIFSPDGRLLASTSYESGVNNRDSYLYVWQVADGRLHRRIRLGDRVYPFAVQFAPDSNQVAVSGDDSLILAVNPLAQAVTR
jgi:WD40 repeat protein